MAVIPIKPGGQGLTPHLTFCPRCGEDDGGMTIGHVVKTTSQDGRVVYVQNTVHAKNKVRTAIKKATGGAQLNHLQWTELSDNEKVPSNDICDACSSELEGFAEIVAQGGVYIKCNACGLEGVARPESELARVTRKASGAGPTAPTGFAFDKCEQHEGATEK